MCTGKVPGQGLYVCYLTVAAHLLGSYQSEEKAKAQRGQVTCLVGGGAKCKPQICALCSVNILLFVTDW